ncbi:YybH family protein [Streptomyces griseofuscus]|uniref:YybH family protein n=1 Tax=Streptomyces griseofuscus TaxID=146922 RepID=UPI0036BF7340
MRDFEAVADRVEIEALRGEFTDAAMLRDYDRLASLFTEDAVCEIPEAQVKLSGRAEIRTGIGRMQAQWEFFVQNTHSGAIRLEGDTAYGRAYIHELGRMRDGMAGMNFALYHDRYRRTADGWKFAERVYEIRYLDTTPLPGSGSSPEPAATS